ncbi:hypothetical protein PSM7751_01616 [Pseudooceanicola marinus]|uniref:Glycosyltransferase RgtA/B/C/D-like domain-containing protein n=1 Tax=Pseudooceanicola marinus TaxID=396013 RepID=A0A1X6Z0X8_9RHOB|nr:hypothetical protein [Pseudooceanicola marinus]PJE32485.1 hypothetical protein CVM50_06160 [Pseudooceanicola marinus]SLN37013.1 hypothetical protein PSM7751_01616 [Pseudooceanicola marinus]
MNRSETGRIIALLIGILAVEAGLIGLAGGFRFNAQAPQMLQLAELVLRSAGGQVAHLDFSSPLGSWSFAPAGLLMRAGMSAGEAMLWAQWGLAVLIAPAVVWIAWSRLAFWPSLALVLLCVTVPLALVPGGTDPVLSLAAQASRWAWALAFLVIPVVLFPPIQGRAGDWADAVVLGLPMAALVMVKPGFALALLPACVLGLLLSGRGRLLLRALLLALAVLALVTLVAGAAYWPAYGRDLLAAAQGAPSGDRFGHILLSPAQTLGTVSALAAVGLLWAMRGRSASGSTLLLLLPGFAWMSYQSAGHDALWLAVLGVVLLGLPGPEVDPDRERILRSLGGVMLVLIGPVLLNLGYSPVRHAVQPAARYSEVGAGQSGLFAPTRDLDRASVLTPWDTRASGHFAGRPLPDCRVAEGHLAYVTRMAAVMGASPALDGQMPFVADEMAPQWWVLGWAPLPGSAPQVHGGLPGYDVARYLLVPLCAISPEVRDRILSRIDPDSVTLIEGSPLYRLYQIDR